MHGWTRRECMKQIGSGVVVGAGLGGGLPFATAEAAATAANGEGKGALALADFQPRSMLHVAGDARAEAALPRDRRAHAPHVREARAKVSRRARR